MIAKIIAWGRDRPEALARLRVRAARDHRRGRGRHDDQVVPARPAGPARGGRRHRRHRLAGPGRASTGRAGAGAARRRRAASASPSTSYDAEEALERGGVPALGPRRPAARHPRGRPRGRARLPGQTYRLTVAQVGPQPVPGRARRPGTSTSRSTGSARSRAGSAVGGRALIQVVRRRAAPVATWSRWTASRHRVSRDEGGVVRAPAPAVVVAVPAPPGDEVEAGADGRRPREHEDGDGGAGAARRAGSARSWPASTRRSTPARRCCGSTAGRRGAAGRRPASGSLSSRTSDAADADDAAGAGARGLLAAMQRADHRATT